MEEVGIVGRLLTRGRGWSVFVPHPFSKKHGRGRFRLDGPFEGTPTLGHPSFGLPGGRHNSGEHYAPDGGDGGSLGRTPIC